MNVRLPEDWVSAYYDGELTPSDRDEAERHLQESPAARAELESYTELSRLLRALPVDTAPAELRHAVMLQAERSLLIPETEAVRPAATSELPLASAPSPRRWQHTGAVVAATMLIATTLVLWNNAPRPLPVSPHVPEMADIGRQAEPLPDASTLEMHPSPIAGSAMVDEAPAGAAMATVRNTIESPDAVSGIELQDGGEMQRATQLSLNEVLIELMNRHPHLLGQMIYYFPSDDEVAVVELTVVDVRRSAGQLQVLLQQNEVELGEGGLAALVGEKKEHFKAAGDAMSQARRKDAEGAGDDLFAVYVQATPEQLAATVHELGLNTSVVDLALHPPLQANVDQLAAGDAQAWEQLDEFLALDDAAASRVRSEKVDEQQIVTAKKSAETDKERIDVAANHKSRHRAPLGEREAVARRKARVQNSYQIVVPVPATRKPAPRGDARRALPHPAVPSHVVDRDSDAPVEAEKPFFALTEKAYARQAEVKVLFVFTRPRHAIEPTESETDE